MDSTGIHSIKLEITTIIEIKKSFTTKKQTLDVIRSSFCRLVTIKVRVFHPSDQGQIFLIFFFGGGGGERSISNFRSFLYGGGGGVKDLFPICAFLGEVGWGVKDLFPIFARFLFVLGGGGG